jgi:hypothetical protein
MVQPFSADLAVLDDEPPNGLVPGVVNALLESSIARLMNRPSYMLVRLPIGNQLSAGAANCGKSPRLRVTCD